MAIAKKIADFKSQSSWIRKMFEDGIRLKNLYGAENVFDFSLGNPNLDPPEKFKKLLIETAHDEKAGVHGYMPNAGLPETREAIASFLNMKQEVNLAWQYIVMTCGAGGALNVVFKTLLDPGDEVVIPTPFFVEYRFYVDNFNAVPKLVRVKKDFSLDIGAIQSAINEKTKIILINSPNNPTGKVYDHESIEALSSMLVKIEKKTGRSIYIVSDEPYREIVYDGKTVPSILKAYRNSIIATSYSKSISVPGERIGYIAVNPGASDSDEIIDGLSLCTRILGFVNAPAMMQRIITGLQGVQVNIGEYQRKRDLLCEGLACIGYEVEKPEGAFYLFLKSPLKNDIDFVKALQEKNILTVPGSGFEGPGYIRLAYCVDDSTIINSMNGFEEVFKKHANTCATV
ncbi:MAG: pyridoxal phosphate-dependent aminotransferase [Syntrophales bacterium]|nr:pyridoxal phosphate-dependent aminotransferase [Syntrophales bacterium]MDY0044240.1 pyridoxal phosphate-dependent aminotransferase [Syntrophales bacterium]